MDGLKISHHDPDVVSNIIKQLNNVFGKESPLTKTHGKIQDYGGMTIDYTEEEKVKFIIFDYLEEIIQNIPKDLRGTAVMLVADHLFNKVNEDAPKLTQAQTDNFFSLSLTVHGSILGTLEKQSARTLCLPGMHLRTKD